jgi:uncharacterized membrane protein
MEKHARTIFKTLSWRILASSTTLLLVYFFTENVVISAGVCIIEMMVKTLIYYVHERVWDKTNFGRKMVNLPRLQSPQYPGFPVKNGEIQKEENV